MKDLPKETRYIEHEYHIVDWHGGDHYGICGQERKCYQRIRIQPINCKFAIVGNVLYSEPLLNCKDYYERIKIQPMNIL